MLPDDFQKGTGVETKRFMKLFRGFELAHGQYRVNKQEADGKMSGRAVTVSEPATEFNFKEHLSGGEYILGVIPLLQNNSCHFGVIDIDIRGDVKLNESLESLEDKIRDTPLVLCRSKSGGAHLYLFANPAIAAVDMVSKLNEFAAQLGYGGSEIFPKQTSREKTAKPSSTTICIQKWNGSDQTQRGSTNTMQSNQTCCLKSLLVARLVQTKRKR